VHWCHLFETPVNVVRVQQSICWQRSFRKPRRISWHGSEFLSHFCFLLMQRLAVGEGILYGAQFELYTTMPPYRKRCTRIRRSDASAGVSMGNMGWSFQEQISCQIVDVTKPCRATPGHEHRFKGSFPWKHRVHYVPLKFSKNALNAKWC